MRRNIRSNKGNSNSPKQLKLPVYQASGTTSKANSADNMTEKTASEDVEQGNQKGDAILAAIDSMKTEFSSRFDGVMTAIENMRKEISDCNERVSQTEQRISNAEDEVADLKTKVQKLESQNKGLEDKHLDLEGRSRMNNLRVLNLPEGAEGRDSAALLKKWIPEALGATLQSALVLERVHRIGPMRDARAPPRTLLMRFQNYKDRMEIMAAARARKEILYEDHQIRFYPDLAAGLLLLRKQFDSARQELRNLGIRHGLIHTAKLLVTYKDRTYTFKTPTEAEDFKKKKSRKTLEKTKPNYR